MATRLLRQWWTQSNHDLLLQSQEKLLSSLIKTPALKRSNSDILNSVEFVSPRSSASEQLLPTIVLAHGFGSGLGFFFRNVDPLLQSGMVKRVLLVDWLGMGGSNRPPCRRPIRGLLTTNLCDSRFTPSRAVDFFIEPFEKWLAEQGVDENLWLVGHSLGGYLAARYAIAYPDRISKLVLASPVGFLQKPTNALPPSDMAPSFRLLDALWSSNVTPQQLVRMMGATRGRHNVFRALRGRIPHLTDNDAELLADYLYHITVAHPSGEFAMNSLLEPAVSPDAMGVFAREPLDGLLLSDSFSAPSMELRVLFGDNDWMRFNEGSARDVVDRMKETKNAPNKASVHIVPNAGHHLYIDNAPEFVRHILAS